MTPPRLVMASMLMAGIFAAGTVGYRLVAGANWWDAFYMTVITLTTVGYAEIFPLSRAGEIFTVALLLAGLGMFLLLATDVARTVVEGEIRQVHTVLTARALNPDLFIVARATEEGAERRILQAGADRVVNPYQLGGIRLAHLVAKPAIVNFFDASLGKHEGLQIDQVSVQAGSSLVGQTLLQANLRKRWGIGVVAVQRHDEVIANPSPDLALEAGDVLVVFGNLQQIQSFEKQCMAA